MQNFRLYTASTSALPESTTSATPQVDTTARKRSRHAEEIPIAYPPAALGHANQINATSTGTLSQVYTTARKRARHEGEIPIAHPPAALGHANHQIEGSNNLNESQITESVMVQEIMSCLSPEYLSELQRMMNESQIESFMVRKIMSYLSPKYLSEPV